jgi:hypothetical protein
MREFQIDSEYKIVFNNDTKHWDYYKNGIPVSKVAPNIYKYYSLNVDNIDSLFNSYFYLANPSSFNDPFDCNINIVEDLDEIIKREYNAQIKRNNLKNIGIVSFSEEIDSHLMWAHYTNNYNGFALFFEGDNIQTFPKDNQILKGTFTKVIYQEKIKKIKNELDFSLHYLLTNKLKHWEYEKEWRFICELGYVNPLDRVLYYNHEKIKGIYVGYRLVEENPSAYRLILGIHELKFPEIPIYVVYPHSTELKLEFEKVKK